MWGIESGGGVGRVWSVGLRGLMWIGWSRGLIQQLKCCFHLNTPGELDLVLFPQSDLYLQRGHTRIKCP